jgi:hypothetical protein
MILMDGCDLESAEVAPSQFADFQKHLDSLPMDSFYFSSAPKSLSKRPDRGGRKIFVDTRAEE